jgi:hypothetical protein
VSTSGGTYRRGEQLTAGKEVEVARAQSWTLVAGIVVCLAAVPGAAGILTALAGMDRVPVLVLGIPLQSEPLMGVSFGLFVFAAIAFAIGLATPRR